MHAYPSIRPMYAPQAQAGASLAPLSPVVAISRGVRGGRPVAGPVGFDAPAGVTDGVSAGVGFLLVGLTCALSYYAGAAMTPSGSKKTTWGLIGIPVGLLTGPIGLGVMGIVSMKK